MSLSDIFSRAFFRTPQERKEADLEKLKRKMEWLMKGDRFGMMLEDELARTDKTEGMPRPVKIEMAFKNLVPADITAEVLDSNHGFAYLQLVAEDAEGKLTVEVTAQKQRAYFWQDEKDLADYAKLTITIDLNQPYDESRIILAEGAAVKAPASLLAPGSDIKARP